MLIETTGDRRLDVPLHTIGGQGVFVKEVQQAVLDGRADIAVHSAKDLPSTPADGLTIGAFTRSPRPVDALVGAPLAELPHGRHRGQRIGPPPRPARAGPARPARSSSCAATSTPGSTKSPTAARS